MISYQKRELKIFYTFITLTTTASASAGGAGTALGRGILFCIILFSQRRSNLLQDMGGSSDVDPLFSSLLQSPLGQESLRYRKEKKRKGKTRVLKTQTNFK
jgi:hypothetical protein